MIHYTIAIHANIIIGFLQRTLRIWASATSCAPHHYIVALGCSGLGIITMPIPLSSVTAILQCCRDVSAESLYS